MFGRRRKSPPAVESDSPQTSKSAKKVVKTESKAQPPETVKPSKSAKQLNTENKALETPKTSRSAKQSGNTTPARPLKSGNTTPAKPLKSGNTTPARPLKSGNTTPAKQTGYTTPDADDTVYRVNNAGLYRATFYSNVGSFFFGIAMGWTSGAEDSVMFRKSYGFTPSRLQWSYVCILLTLGAMVWCLPMGFLLRWCGCKRTILAQMLPNALGWCLTAWGHNINMLYAGRFLLGMCGGALSVAVPIYSAEISTARKRGIMGVCFYGACIVGMFYSVLMSSFLEIKIVNLVNIILLVFLLLQFLMPESPVYYVQRRKMVLAEDTLRWLRGRNHNVSKELANLMRSPTISEHDQHQHPEGGFKYSGVRRSLARVLVLAVLHKLCGAYIFILYSHKLVACLGLPYRTIAALGFAALAGFVVCLFLVDRIGRKPLLAFGLAIMFFSSVIIGIGFKLFLDNGGHVLPVVTFFFMPVFVGAYTAGLGTLTWLLTVELFVPPMRPLCCSIAATVSWLCASAAILWYSTYTIVCQPYLFLLFAIVAVVSLLFTLSFIPETKALSSKNVQKRLIIQKALPTPETTSEESDAEITLY